ncbi:type III pantothenate kinase [Sulfurospirillum diekertiae]|jgi:type III pantothenate kinase|uniref:Type III pantothenate kinase n=1 Tax=Sulfurospirillum diekertiae TaxID=1854492 RepID=A0A6G9VVB7_9BACT|nr:type III pantothenate kinase [Sulfurospirillum diekertiae]QIR76641.1 type III pantothenate kinase [Sulfurospirillum diekertiae]QIR79270.1 type III pantothenate kinase [Sulfurospirillum diekertiae]
MILCDIGNSNADFYQDGKVWTIPHKQFKEFVATEKVYYISVSEALKTTLQSKNNFIDLEPFFEFDTIYQGMGIDRIAACSTIRDGMIVDAGSAITVDIMSGGMHLGGFILPGLSAYEKCYASISPRLMLPINPSISLDALPQKTNDAISYGVIKSIIMLLEITCKDKRIFFTGGDGKFFSKFFSNAIFDRTLIFRGMLKTIKDAHLE